MKTVSVQVWGGFHDVTQPISMRLQVDEKHGGVSMSVGQYKRLQAHMCGMRGCICGPHHGWRIDGAEREDVLEAMACAAHDEATK